MANLSRKTAKIFGETATTTGNDPEIGQFGSAKAGTYVGTNDIDTIQALPAWSNGWVDAVTPTQQFPPLPEMTAVHHVMSYQLAYMLQKGIPDWLSTETYYQNDFCKSGNKMYYSLVDNNTNNAPESSPTYWEEFSSGASRNIGEIVASTIPLTDAGLHLLDGSLIQYGSYQAFVDYIADLYDSGDYTAIFETEANWQTAVTTYGVCGKFVYDSVNNTVRLPKITGIVEGTTDLTALGDLVEAGLPNITGTFIATTWTNAPTSTGAFSTSSTATSGYRGTSPNDCQWTVTLNAANSSSIYGNSPTVQPQTIKVLYYIVIANSTKTQIQVDIDEIATDLNGKADVDLTNVNNSGKILMSRMGMPSSTYTDLTLGASGSTYTAPSNGWVYISKQAGTSGKYVLIAVDGKMNVQTHASANSDYLEIYMPVLQGDVFEVYYSATGTTNSFRFVYAQGSESEAS